jgi:flavin reductase (DIM6/NTAB) family NADH-FMN oxidoreductase RutF
MTQDDSVESWRRQDNVPTVSITRVVHPRILYFGTPVVLLSTENEDGTPNITPMSSAWALGDTIVLGLGEGGQGLANLRARPQCVVNLPDDSLWRAVEALAPLTGASPVPKHKQAQFRHERNKFAAAGLTPAPSRVVTPPRIAECPLQIEAEVAEIHTAGDPGTFAIIETRAVAVHAHEHIMEDDTHISPGRWNPLIYNFRHYFGLGAALGKTFRAEV